MRALTSRTTAGRRGRRTTMLALVGVLLCALLPTTTASGGSNAWSRPTLPRGARATNARVLGAPGAESLYVCAVSQGVWRTGETLMWQQVGEWPSPAIGAQDIASAPPASADATLVAATTWGVHVLGPDATAWQEVAGTGLGTRNCQTVCVLDADTWIVGTNLGGSGGIQRTTNAGATWGAAFTDTGDVSFLESIGTTLVAGSYSTGLWTSTDDGGSWTQSVGHGFPDVAMALDLQVAPDGTWWASTINSLYRSTDTGGTWTKVADRGAYSIAFDGSNPVVVCGGIGISFSTNGGDAWTDTGAPGLYQERVVSWAGHLLAMDDGLGVYEAPADRTQTWTAANDGFPAMTLTRVAITDGGRMVAEGKASNQYAGLFYSDDGGATWALVPDNDVSGVHVVAVDRADDGKIVAATWAGMFATYDGLDWVLVGPPSGMAYNGATNGDGSLILSAGWSSVMQAAPDASSWTVRAVHPTGNPYDIEFTDENTILYASPAGISRLTTASATWQSVYSATDAYSLHRAANGKLYAGAGNKVWGSTDDGETWTELASFDGAIWDIWDTSGGAIWAVVSGTGIMRSTNEGVVWQQLGVFAHSGAAYAASDYAGTRFMLSTDSGDSGVYSIVRPDVTFTVSPADPAPVGGWYKGPRSLVFERPAGGTTYWAVDDTWKASGLNTTTTAAVEGSHTVTYYGTTTFTASDAQSTVVRVDSIPPQGTMRINNGATSTNKLAATINASIVDTSSGLTQMRVKVGTSAWGAWKPYAASSAVTLPGYDGTKTVYAEYRDAVGNVKALSDSIKFVRASVSVTRPALSTSSPRRNRSFTTYGYVSPKAGGYTKLTFQRKVGSTYRTVKTVTVKNTTAGSRSKYSYKAKFGTAGTYRVRAYFKGTSAYATRYSYYKSFKVK